MRTFMIAVVFGLGTLGAGALSACGRAPQRPADSAVAGTWVLRAECHPSLVKRMGRAPKDSRIVFMTDGRFSAVDMPMEDPFRKPTYRFFTGEGRWSLEDQNGWMLSLTIDRGGHPLYFGDQGALPKVIYTFVDGPDSGETWMWDRAN